MSRRPKSKAREIPQWKLDMLAETQTEPAVKRARPNSTLADDDKGIAAVAAVERNDGAAIDCDDDDDDDGDDVNLSAYNVGGDDSGAEEAEQAVVSGMAEPVLTREEQLLERERADTQVWGYRLDGGRRRPGKQIHIDDEGWGSGGGRGGLSLGGERAKERKRALEAAANLGISAVAPGGRS
eukprot:CAMPEP_0183345778 /NCGR_PEP_ID=MMETSP0164_2-20130417/11109_1 /TAXON_ID=221442 /ORGANISM="Coccolithus pelagicus ssp braarudi, Strain PLY182g" /LENGTH=181 /DNA_ID=CAMNT_0025516969 /DNA_START=52 /DNA_END=597 /DNA_ORIENTATION=-